MAANSSINFQTSILGRTGLQVGRLGVAASYGVPADAVERAFERGSNYFYWGSRRTGAFGEALRRLAPKRESFVLAIQSYSRIPGLIGWSLERALKSLRFEYADLLLLGLWNKEVSGRILDASRKLKDRGLVRFLAASTHTRTLVPKLAAASDIDVIHVRYNAAHPGAEQDVFPHLPHENRPGLVAFTATSWGQLLGKRTFGRRSLRLPDGETFPSSTDCYRFVLTRPEVNVCMTGPADAAQMDRALDALRLGPMTEDELAWMRRVGRTVSGK